MAYCPRVPVPEEKEWSRAVTSCMSGPRSGLDEGSRLSQYTLVPVATERLDGLNELPWIKTRAWTLMMENG